MDMAAFCNVAVAARRKAEIHAYVSRLVGASLNLHLNERAQKSVRTGVRICEYRCTVHTVYVDVDVEQI